MRRAMSVGVAAGLGASACTQFENRNVIDVKVRVFGSNDPWVDSLTLQSGNLVDPIVVEVATFLYRIDGYYGFATSVHNIIGYPYSAAAGDRADLATFDNPDSALHPDDRVGHGSASGGGGFNNGGQAQQVYATGEAGVDANRFRIAGPSNAGDAVAGGISIHQNTPSALGTKFDTSNGAMAYHFRLSLACYNGGAARTVTIETPSNRINSFAAYLTSTSSTSTNIAGSFPWNMVYTDPASVTVSWVPGPGVPAVLGLSALLAGRRGRAARGEAPGSATRRTPLT